jgi:hypothetical protein
MPSALLHALAAAADPYAPLYAQGLVDGYLAGTARNAARRTGAGER